MRAVAGTGRRRTTSPSATRAIATADWLHAVLHKIEGDDGNARYWYRRTQHASTSSPIRRPSSPPSAMLRPLSASCGPLTRDRSPQTHPAQLALDGSRHAASSIALAVVLVVAAAVPRRSPATCPTSSTFGYEDEGKVDASPAGCEAVVKEIVEWPEPRYADAIKDVCGARKRACRGLCRDPEELQGASPSRSARITGSTRPPRSQHFEAMVKACIDHKSNVTTGGHNIMIDVIPNDIAARLPGYGQEHARRGDDLADDRPEKHARFSP